MLTAMKVVADVAQVHALVGTELGTSEWFEITQERVNAFGDVTDDRQRNHIEPRRARLHSPFGGPIAHGYLTLPLFSMMWAQIPTVQNAAMDVNYGLNKVRFPAPVPVGAKVRMHARMNCAESVPGGVQMTVGVTIECDRTNKPVCVAEAVYRIYAS
jgi:acyl dehydratase